MSALDITNLSAGYGSCRVLNHISAKAETGQFIALLGPNGGGKSTLLKSLCGIVEPQSGVIKLDGLDVSAMNMRTRARQISYLAQSREAAPALTVEDIVRLGRAPFRGSLGRISPKGHDAIENALVRTQVEKFRARAYDGLSGGEQARVLLARALAVEAPVLLADEPIAALDPFYQLTMMDILKAETVSGKTVIAALHDLALATQFADRIWVMHQGRIIADDVPKKALSSDILKTVFGIKAPKGGFKPTELSG